MDIAMSVSAKVTDMGHNNNLAERKLCRAPELVFVPIDEGVIIDGLRRPEIIRGPVAQTLLPRLLELMNGQKTIAQLAESCPQISSTEIATLIDTLLSWGLIRTDEMTLSARPMSPTRAFLNRFVLSRGLPYTYAEACYAALRAPKIAILYSRGLETAATLLRDALLASESVTTCIEMLETVWELPVASVDIAVTLTVAGISRVELEKVSSWVVRNGKRWLQTAISGDGKSVTIGPMFGEAGTGCFSCFAAMYGIGADAVGETILSRTALLSWIGLVGLELFSICTRLPLSASSRTMRTYYLEDLSSKTMQYAERPACLACLWHERAADSPGTGEVVHEECDTLPTPFVFEQLITMDNSSLDERNDHTVSAFQATLLAPPKRWPSASRIDLGKSRLNLDTGILSLLQGQRPKLRSHYGVSEVASLLALATGVRSIDGAVRKRWVPTAGNLGSTEVYLVAERLPGVARGIYLYEADTHSLALSRRRKTLGASEFLRRLLNRFDQLPAAMLLIVGSLERLKPKYGMFGYRLLHLDAGVAGAQATLAGMALGLSVQTVPLCGSPLVEQTLGLRHFEEQAMLGLVLGSRPSSELRSLDTAESLSTNNRDVHSPSFYRGLSQEELARIQFQECQTNCDVMRTVAFTLAEHASHSVRPDLSTTTIEEKGLTLSDILDLRTSTRAFKPDYIPVEDITVMLGAVCSSGNSITSRKSRRAINLGIVVVALRVEGLLPGVYEYAEASQSMTLIKGSLTQADLAALMIQEDLGTASCIFCVTGSIAAATELAGSSGHAYMLMEAGKLAYSLSMAAYGLGLSGTLAGGFTRQGSSRILLCDGFHKMALIGFAAGAASSTNNSN